MDTMNEAPPEPVDPAPSTVSPAAKDRRTRPRQRDGLPAFVAVAGKLRLRRLRVELSDYDGEGACLVCARSFEPGTALSVRFRMPRALCGPFAGLSCRARGQVRTARERADGRFEVVIKWDAPIAQLVDASVSRHQYRVGAWVVLSLVALAWLKWDNMRFFWYEPYFYGYSFIVSLYFLTRFGLWRYYQPPGLPPPGFEPSISIVISVRDEQDAIAKTIASCFETEYPDDKREVLVVDDGSQDSTPAVLRELLPKYPKLRVFTIPPSGKRAGMATGVRHSSGELIVFVDSDTFLYRDALRMIIRGFEDPTLGASAGHTEVANADVNALTGLQEVRYLLSFRLMKAAESVFSCVTCCPGCLSAYRKSYLVAVIEPWLNQKFLGAKATFGDDRSLTNFILRDHRVIYNSLAAGSTLVPETWKRYLTQQVRWKKSWLRETLIAGRFMRKKHPVAALSFYMAAFCSVFSPLIVFRAAYLGCVDPQAFLSYYAAGLILVGFSQCLMFLVLRPNSRWLLGMLVVASQVVVLGPQTYYALLTMRRNHWGTRSG